MVIIPQHGKSGELYDMRAFLADVDIFFEVQAWRIRIDECLGEGAEEIERLSAKEVVLSDAEFRMAYQGIYQTIDGSFTGLRDGDEVISLLAVDSTSWDICGSREFEDHMLRKYGGRNHHEV